MTSQCVWNDAEKYEIMGILQPEEHEYLLTNVGYILFCSGTKRAETAY